MKTLGIDDLYDMHNEAFGVDPVITGSKAFNAKPISERIVDAIDAGTPYVEAEVPEDTMV